MGVVIQFDFKKHAADREAARRAKEKPVADLSNLYPPHTWPAGPDDEPEIATVMTLDGTFRDNALYAAIPQGDDHYSVLQFAPHVTPDTLADAKPVGRFYIPAAILKEQFTAMDRPAEAKLGHHFARMALQSDNPGQQAQLYSLAVAAVHLIVESGLYAFGNGQITEHYHTGDTVVEYKGGSIAHGPAASMLARLTPMNRDARIALNHAPEHLVTPRPQGPDGFNF
jgi:hypothetical protein